MTTLQSLGAMPTARFPIVDVLRGVAIVLMVAFHFTLDLNFYGIVHVDFTREPFWLNARIVIVSLFLLLVGVSLHLATRHGICWRPFGRRLGLLLLCAVLVSVASYWMFPQRYIYFGILHFIAVASVLGLLFIRLYWNNLLLGMAAIAAGVLYQHPLFDTRLTGSIGFMTFKPPTEDYVPLFPWFGVVLIGLWLGRWLFTRQALPAVTQWQADAPITRALAFGGRHSLLIYMLHQPLLLGALYLLVR